MLATLPRGVADRRPRSAGRDRRHRRRLHRFDAGLSAYAGGNAWGQRHLRWHHQDDLHELRCTNHGFREAKAPLVLAWQDDMFLRSAVARAGAAEDVCRVRRPRASLSQPRVELHRRSTIRSPSWEDLIDWRRLQSTIGAAAHELVSPAGSRSRDPPVGRPARTASMPSVCSTRRSSRPNGTKPISAFGSAAQAGKSRRTDTSVLGAYHHLGSTTAGCAFRRIQATGAPERPSLSRTMGRHDSPRIGPIPAGHGGGARRPRDGGGRPVARRGRWRRRSADPEERACVIEPPAVADRAVGDRFAPRGLVEAAGERLRSAPLGSRVRAWAKRAYHAALMLQTGGRGLSCTLPGGERIRALPEHRYLSWNPQEYAAFRRVVSPRMVALDVGANVGAYSMLLGQWVGPAGRVYAFEPAPHSVQRAGPAHSSERSRRRRSTARGGGRRSRDAGRVPAHGDGGGEPSGCARRSSRRAADRAGRHD